ncbi:hypothetical protein SESBI_01255 [Sesbania bispinosa]|nr:hypothetical protein SESBI_01255 [Sesbania bispinosa]
MAKSLKIATVESTEHSHEKLTFQCFQQGGDVASSVVKMCLLKENGSKGRVLAEWVVCHQRLKASVIYYESVKSASPPHNIFIMYKYPYYVTSIVNEFEKLVSMKNPIVAKHPFSQVTTPPRRAYEHLKARPAQDSPYCFPSSSFDVVSESDQEDTSTSHATGSDILRGIGSVPASHPQAVIRNFSVEVVILPADVDTPIFGSSLLSPFLSGGVHAFGSASTTAFLSQMFSEDGVRLLSNFSARHIGFLLSETFPLAYQCLAYEQFLDLLKCFRANPILTLLGPLMPEILDKLKMHS